MSLRSASVSAPRNGSTVKTLDEMLDLADQTCTKKNSTTLDLLTDAHLTPGQLCPVRARQQNIPRVNISRKLIRILAASVPDGGGTQDASRSWTGSLAPALVDLAVLFCVVT